MRGNLVKNAFAVALKQFSWDGRHAAACGVHDFHHTRILALVGRESEHEQVLRRARFETRVSVVLNLAKHKPSGFSPAPAYFADKVAVVKHGWQGIRPNNLQDHVKVVEGATPYVNFRVAVHDYFGRKELMEGSRKAQRREINHIRDHGNEKAPEAH